MDNHAAEFAAAVGGATLSRKAQGLLDFLLATSLATPQDNTADTTEEAANVDTGVAAAAQPPAVSLSDLCARNHLRRGQAARCFYNCLVLIGGGYLDAEQDVSVPYGDIVLIRGPAFSSTATAEEVVA